MQIAYRDAGFWTQLWHVLSSLWTHGHRATFPPDHFVGLVSTSSAAIDPGRRMLTSVGLRRVSTSEGRLWRLTYGWETRPRPPLATKYGPLSVESGPRLSPEPDGEATSRPPTRTTST